MGCRDRKEKNFTGIDLRQHPGVDIVWDIHQKFPYPIKAGSVLTIKCAHVFEHVPPWKTIAFMDELWRMLIPQGQLALSCPYGLSPGWTQDPTHCTIVTDRTFQHFDPKFTLYSQYSPKPWTIEHVSWKLTENIEVVLRKAPEVVTTPMPVGVEASIVLAQKALSLGAMQKINELACLLSFIRDRKLETVVEIGTARGGVLYSLCQSASENAVIVSIDLPRGEFGGGYKASDEDRFRAFAKGKQKMSFLRLDSHLESTKRKLSGIVGKVDLLFIDGDHTYKGVKKDWKMYAPMVKKGGIVVFHDICHHPTVPTCQVDKFWKEIKEKKMNVIEFIDPMDISWGGIGVVLV